MVVGPRFPPRLAETVRTVVCVRPFVDEPMAAELAGLRGRGVRLIADFDDLLFDGPPELFPSVLQGRFTADHIARRIGIYKRGLGEFAAFIASTAPLAEHLRALHPGVPVRVVPNGLSRPWVRAGRLVARRHAEGDAKVIRYFAGSPTHDADLAHVAPALARFMRRHHDVRLELAGMFDRIPGELPTDRITRLPIRPYVMLPQLLAPTWVSIAPLLPTPFSRCKSDIKFLEAAAFGVPTVASASAAYETHDGNGLLACTEHEDWLDALESLREPAIRGDLSTRAEATVEAEGYADRNLEAWIEAATDPNFGLPLPGPSSRWRRSVAPPRASLR